MLTIVKRGQDEIVDWLQSEAGFITSLCHYQGRPIDLEPYQVAFLADRQRFRWVTKARQVGLSFVLALEALARCHLRDNYTAVFVSFNLDEAKEKILLARQVFEEMPLAFQKRLVVDAKTELAFESSGPRSRVSRLISVPSKAPRGKHGDIILDELAHYLNDREVYRGSTALVLRSNGQLTGCSTPLGRRGVFWEVATQELRPYPHHSRRVIPWWLCRTFCNNPAEAASVAQELGTAQMVERYGSEALIEQYDSLGLEDFEQEFCARFVDESYSFFAYELILPNTSDDVVLAEDFADLPTPAGRLVAGFDVGRTRDRSELALFEHQGDKLVCRMLRSYHDIPFAEQEADLRRMLDILPVARLSVDQSGIGMHLAENLARDFPQVVRENFTNESKERWATDFKILLQRRRVLLPKDRDLVAQIHSIRKRVLPSGKVSFDGDRTMRQGHADRFWAVALACQKERGANATEAPTVTVRAIGTRAENRATGAAASPSQERSHPLEAGPASDEPVLVPLGGVNFWPFGR